MYGTLFIIKSSNKTVKYILGVNFSMFKDPLIHGVTESS